MSLDVYLTLKDISKPRGSGIFIRVGGQTREISQEEWSRRFPGRVPVLVKYPPQEGDETNMGTVYAANITHNLNTMAQVAGIYPYLWQPEEVGISRAEQLIEPLEKGLAALESDPARFEAYNPKNGWGDYSRLVSFVREYLAACKQYPGAEVAVWR